MQVLAHGQMRQLGERRENTGLWRNLIDKGLLAIAGLSPTDPICGCDGNAAAGSEENLGRDARGNYEKGERASNRNRQRRPSIDSGGAFGERNPKQREKGSRVMKVNGPLRRTPGEEMLEEDRARD